MTVGAEETERLLALHRRAVEQTEQAAHLLVEFRRRVLSLLDSLLVGLGEIVTVVGIGLAHRQSVGPGAELQVESVPDGLVGIVAATPVADHHPVEAPVLLQDLVEHDIIVAIVLVFIEIVCAHDAPCLALLYSCLERRQVDLVQGPVADDDVHLMTILLIVVQSIVLHAGCHALRLQPFDVGHHHA